MGALRRQRDAEDCSTTLRTNTAAHDHSALMSFYDLFGKRQPEPGAAIAFRAEEGLKDRLGIITRDSMSIVCNQNVNTSIALMEPHRKRSLLRQSVKRIDDQVRHNLQNLAAMHLCHQRFTQVLYQVNPLLVDGPLVDAQSSLRQEDQITGSRNCICARKSQRMAHDFVERLHLLISHGHVASDQVFIVRALTGQVGQVAQRFQGITDFMHDFERKMPSDNPPLEIFVRLALHVSPVRQSSGSIVRVVLPAATLGNGVALHEMR